MNEFAPELAPEPDLGTCTCGPALKNMAFGPQARTPRYRLKGMTFCPHCDRNSHGPERIEKCPHCKQARTHNPEE